MNEGDYSAPEHCTMNEGDYSAPEHYTMNEGDYSAPEHYTMNEGDYSAPEHYTLSKHKILESFGDTRLSFWSGVCIRFCWRRLFVVRSTVVHWRHCGMR